MKNSSAPETPGALVRTATTAVLRGSILALTSAVLAGVAVGRFGTTVLWASLGLMALAFAFFHPFIALLAALFSDLYLIHVNLYGEFGPRNYAVLILFVGILVPTIHRGNISISPVVRRILQISAVMMGWIVVVNILNGLPLTTSLDILALLAVSAIIGWATSVVLSSETMIKWFVAFLIGGLALSSFVAVMQYGGVDLFWQMRLALGVDPNNVVGMQIIDRVRVPGLSYYSINLANQLVWAAPLVLGLLIARPTNRWLTFGLVMLASLLAAGALVTLTRSAVIGLIASYPVIMILSKVRPRASKADSGALASVAVVALVIVALTVFSETRLLTVVETSPRYTMVFASFLISSLHIFGVGTSQFSAAVLEIYPQIQHLSDAGRLLSTSAHNQFLNTLVYYGFPGLTILILFYIVLLRSVLRSSLRASSPLTRGLAIGLGGGYAAYLVNSLFHNAGPFIGDPFHWYFVGLTGALEARVLRETVSPKRIAVTTGRLQ
jgi:hypothetical protein